jgi:hypothetical protein
MYYARAFERRAAAYQALSAPPQRGPRPSLRSTLLAPTPGQVAPTAGTPGGSAPTPAAVPFRFQRLSLAEQQERRCQGLYFNCDEPYVRGHVCQRLFYLLNDDYVDDVVPAEVAAAAVFQTPVVALLDPDPEAASAGAPSPHVSLHALTGVRTENAMVLHVTVKGQQLVALLDSGSTTNFINAELCARLQLATDPRPALQVLVANGDGVPCQGVTHNVPISINTEAFSTSCFGITLGSFDLILGYDYLRALGPILWDFAHHRLSFIRGGQRVTWLGVGASGGVEPAVRATLTLAAQPLLDRLLEQFGNVFEEPRGLPPARPYDHRIHLLPGTAPVAVRPYRYPHLQKDELERQCSEMLRQGIIRPSTSPFSAPVLLVRKADNSWRFCIDYRALNAVTSKDKFLIPVVDELLDELHGARFFSKMDLRSSYHQVRMHPADILKPAFRTHEGHYEFLVMPFGLANAPATFQSLMNDVLRPYLSRFVLMFFDDILIYSSSWAEHLQHLAIALKAIRDPHLHLKLSKCSFGAASVAYLGHVISAAEVAMDADKVSAVESCPFK